MVEFEPYLKEIQKLGIEGTMALELEYAPQPDQIEAWVGEAYEATDRLMQKIGMRG